MTPLEANEFVAKEMLKEFPLGDLKLPSSEDLKFMEVEEGVV
jgi:hypothetical protein